MTDTIKTTCAHCGELIHTCTSYRNKKGGSIAICSALIAWLNRMGELSKAGAFDNPWPFGDD